MIGVFSGFDSICLRTFFFLTLMAGTTGASAQWEFIGSPEKLDFGGMSATGDTVYLSTVGNIYYTNDQGQTWHPIPDVNSFITVSAPHFDGNRMYVIAHTFELRQQLFVSTNRGGTWEKLEMFNDDQLYSYLTRGDTVIVLARHKLFVSFDGGKTATHTYSTASTGWMTRIQWLDNTLVGISAVNNDTFRIWHSSDLGNTWTGSTSLEADNIERIGDHLWAHVIDTSTKDQSFLISKDKGITWDSQYTIQIQDSIYYIDLFGDDERIFITENEWGDEKIHTSTDEGETWSVIPIDMGAKYHPNWLVSRLWMFSHEFAAFKQIVSSTDFGQTWEASNAGIKEARVETLVVPGEDIIWLDEDFSPDGGDTWEERPQTLHRYASSGNGHMVGEWLRNIYQSHDGGLTWTFIKKLTEGSAPAMVHYLNEKYIITYKTGHATISNDGGDTWSSVFNVGGELKDVGFSDGKYYAHLNGDIVVSEDFRNWDAVTYNLYNLHYNTGDGGLILHDNTILRFNNRMYRLDLNSVEWQLSPYVNAGVYPPSNYPKVEHVISYGDAIIAACNGLGVFISHNTGLSWHQLNDGLGNLRANKLAYDDEYLYVGMKYGGVWRMSLSELENYTVIEGTTFYDKNQNGLKESFEVFLPRITVTSRNSDAFVHSRYDGTYSLYTDVVGQDTIEAIRPHPFSYVTTPPQIVDGSTDSVSFGIYMEEIYDLVLDITNVTPARPGFDLSIELSVVNALGLPTDGRLVLYLDPSVPYLGADRIPTFVSVDSIVWEFDHLGPGETFLVKSFFHVPVNVGLNALLHFNATVIPVINDAVPQNNYARLDLITVGAYDPNEKAVFPEGAISTAMLEDTARLVYTIRFQNLGNYQADRVRIVDTLSEALDIYSLEIISASHAFTSRVRQGRILEFVFDPILLPPASADEQGSHGFVKYAINAVSGLQSGDKITNQAHIYFDFNVPVSTNRIVSGIEEITVSTGNPNWIEGFKCQLEISPNPASQMIEVNIPQEIELPAMIHIVDHAGRIVTTERIDNYTGNKLNIRRIPTGMFSIMISSKDQKTCVGKFVKN